MPDTLLSIRDLRTWFDTSRGPAKAVDGVDLELGESETMAVVGESGCGKTVLSLSILRLVPSPPGRIAGGEVVFKGRDLLQLSEREMRAVRGNEISMIFQEPMTSLNPVFTVGEQVAEALRLHKGMNDKQALEAAGELLHQVGIPKPTARLHSYPHELSGGMRQRIVIAMALACDPDLILADEPTTALDVTIQAQILDLMLDLTRERKTAILLITHDLGVVAQTCSKVMVMYAGKAVEAAPTRPLFKDPLHPYTQGLLHSLPRPEAALEEEKGNLTPIPGAVPALTNLPTGCTFHPRCPKRFDPCDKEPPPFFERSDGRRVRCWLYG